MKSKIGIVTLHGYWNYGNKLQNYALKYTLEKLDFDVTTTVIKNNQTNNNILPKLKKISFDFLKLKCKEIFVPSYKKEKVLMQQMSKNRIKHFKSFSEKYLNEKFYYLDNKNDRERLNKLDYFITGSDQVWNPIEYNNLPIYFLTFTDTSKRISYSPSIGVDKIPENLIEEYREWLRDMKVISVREEAGASIIKQLINKDVPVLVDPTMLLNKNEWLNIAKKADTRPEEPYLLTYFLGGPPPETRDEINKIAKQYNMKIINLADASDKESFETGPSEFLDFINNANLFFTDSFHGVVFSIIFQTPFIVYERISSGSSMYSRIETILDNFNMRDRESKGFKGDVFSMDFSGTHEVIDREYNKSVNYLKEALRIEE